MKVLKIAKKTLKQIKEDIEKEAPDYITGSIKDLKKLGLDQSSEVLGVKVKPEPEEVELESFETRQELDDYVENLLGDNLTLNRMNSHRLVGTKEDTDRLSLSKSSSIWGVGIRLND